MSPPGIAGISGWERGSLGCAVRTAAERSGCSRRRAVRAAICAVPGAASPLGARIQTCIRTGVLYRGGRGLPAGGGAVPCSARTVPRPPRSAPVLRVHPPAQPLRRGRVAPAAAARRALGAVRDPCGAGGVGLRARPWPGPGPAEAPSPPRSRGAGGGRRRRARSIGGRSPRCPPCPSPAPPAPPGPRWCRCPRLGTSSGASGSGPRGRARNPGVVLQPPPRTTPWSSL